jgi:hypothetical protein
MKKIFLFTLIFIASFCKAQKINLSNKEELINYLNKKEFTVGEYGKMVIKYDDYDKAFNALKFKVEFTPASSEKKPKKVQLEAMIFENDGFYSPDYLVSDDVGGRGCCRCRSEGVSFEKRSDFTCERCDFGHEGFRLRQGSVFIPCLGAVEGFLEKVHGLIDSGRLVGLSTC